MQSRKFSRAFRAICTVDKVKQGNSDVEGLPMQPANTDRQRANARLRRPLPANEIKATTSPIHHKQDKPISKSAPHRSSQIAGKQNPSTSFLTRTQTDLREIDTERSLSSCPTYSSLSRHSPETRVSRDDTPSTALSLRQTSLPCRTVQHRSSLCPLNRIANAPSTPHCLSTPIVCYSLRRSPPKKSI